MPVCKILNIAGEQVGDLELNELVFAAPIHVPAMHQVVVAQLANARQGTASAKMRGEVRGGGKKPWRQKHTGRARVGSIRSPLWVGGGVVHGPKPRSYRQKVNKKVRALAMCSALSARVAESKLFALDSIKMDTPSTKTMKKFLDNLGGKKVLFLMDTRCDNFVKSVSNLPGAKVIHMDSINVLDLVNHDSVVATPEVFKRLEEVYAR